MVVFNQIFFVWLDYYLYNLFNNIFKEVEFGADEITVAIYFHQVTRVISIMVYVDVVVTVYFTWLGLFKINHYINVNSQKLKYLSLH